MLTASEGTEKTNITATKESININFFIKPPLKIIIQ
jgi:hypothetical protein